MTKRYAARRFTSGRPDAFEVYDLDTGKCASFPMFAYQAKGVARRMTETAAGRQMRWSIEEARKAGARDKRAGLAPLDGTMAWPGNYMDGYRGQVA